MALQRLSKAILDVGVRVPTIPPSPNLVYLTTRMSVYAHKDSRGSLLKELHLLYFVQTLAEMSC